MDPRLSIVVTSRNDAHGGNMMKRMRLFVNGLLQQCKAHQLPAELIFVEWNPPQGTPALHEVLPQPQEGDFLSIRYITVPKEIHDRYHLGGVIPLFQMTAKNVGIRRARAEFVLCTNVDLLFSDALMQAMKPDKLDRTCFYRANRCDVPDGIDETWPLAKQLAWCAQHIIRRNGFHRDFPLINLGELGWQDKPRWVLWYSSFFAARARAKQSYPDRMYYLLDKEACGDFTLMHRDAWQDIQGYLELDMYSIHIDTLGIAAAVAIGYKQEILPREACTYHIDHPTGWSSMGGVEKIKFSESRPGLGTDVVYQAAVEAIRDRKPYHLNPENWGLNDVDLQEIEFSGK